jgi:hypothetical protein
MKKTLTLTLALITVLAFAITAYADAIPAKKTQIDWLISGAGGDLAALGGNPENGTGMFSYDFMSENGSISGRVEGRGGVITIIGSDEAVEFAQEFTRHFATLTRTGHFHASHRLSAKSTEEFPIEVGSHIFMTFCYDADADGGMMNAMIFDHAVKLVTNLSNGGFAVSHGGDDECELDTQTQEAPAQAPTGDAVNPGANPKTGAENFIIPVVVITSAAAIASRKRKNK